jgi:hypothetical protein
VRCSLRQAFLIVLLVTAVAAAGHAQESDERICAEIFSYARDRQLADRPVAAVVAEVAKRFLGSPYEAQTLDRGSEERVVTNLRTFDCVTLVENVLALARCIKLGTASFAAYRTELERIRYRGGVCRGYATRLHYFSDWIADGEKKGILRDVSRDLGGREMRKKIDFMSAHRDRYPRLKADSSFRAIASAERALSLRPRYVLPAGGGTQIPSGSIIAIATSVRGLDVTHTGIAVTGADGRMYLLHAPDTGDTVKISAEPLATYAGKSPSAAGMIVAVPLEPR